MSAESVALDAKITSYLAHHPDPIDWPNNVRAFDVSVYCGELALDAAAALHRMPMFQARLVVAAWIEDNEANRPAQWQLTKYIESLP